MKPEVGFAIVAGGAVATSLLLRNLEKTESTALSKKPTTPPQEALPKARPSMI